MRRKRKTITQKRQKEEIDRINSQAEGAEFKIKVKKKKKTRAAGQLVSTRKKR